MSRSKNKVRYAIVGLGHIAQVAVLPAFKAARNSELFALVSGDPEKLRKLGKKYNLAHLYPYEEYSRALSNVDAVFLTLPNHLHREYSVRAAAAGVHVLCEKPMAPTTQECREMIEAANRNHVKLMVAYRLHFETGNLEAIKLAKEGKLGDVRAFTSEFAQQVADNNVRVKEPVPRGGGPLYDMGVYCINAARYLFRSEPLEVGALAASKDEQWGSSESRRWCQRYCVFRANGWRHLRAVLEPPTGAATSSLGARAFFRRILPTNTQKALDWK